MHDEFESLRFISEPMEAGFDEAPVLEKKPGCPQRFVWREDSYEIIALLAEWHDFGRRGRMAVNMRPDHATAAERQGSWGVGRDYYRVRTDRERIFDIYYDRSPSRGGGRKGGWFVYRELRAIPSESDR